MPGMLSGDASPRSTIDQAFLIRAIILPRETRPMNHPIEQNAMPPLSATAADAAKTAIYSGKRKAFVLVMLLVSWILANADRMAMSISIVPISKDFNLDARSAGLLLSAFYVSIRSCNWSRASLATASDQERFLFFLLRAGRSSPDSRVLPRRSPRSL